MEDMSDERLIECDSFSTDIPRIENKLVYGKVYRLSLYKGISCIYLGKFQKNRKLRQLIAFRVRGEPKVFTFGQYSLYKNVLKPSDIGVPVLRKSEKGFVIRLLEKKLGNQTK
jgi:hypothetical protein